MLGWNELKFFFSGRNWVVAQRLLMAFRIAWQLILDQKRVTESRSNVTAMETTWVVVPSSTFVKVGREDIFLGVFIKDQLLYVFISFLFEMLI